MISTTDRAFLDTNILLYAFDRKDERKRRIASELIDRAFERDYWISAQVLHEFYVNVTRKVSPRLDAAAASRQVADLSQINHIDNRVEDLPGILVVVERNQLGFWDAMIVHAACRLDCRVLYTEDLSAGQVFGRTRVVNPFADYLPPTATVGSGQA